MSTSCVFPLGTARAFELAEQAGFDGVEVMVTQDPITQDSRALAWLAARHEQPVLSIHAPVLLLTQHVWGFNPRTKLERSVELALDVGASTVVVHPPFRWQAGYGRQFLDIVRELSTASGVDIAVENMFTWTVRGHALAAYAPGWDPIEMDCDAVTLDFSHAALSGRDSLEMAGRLGARLRHVHLCDGSAPEAGKMFDEHLLPGRGAQPVAETLRYLTDGDWSGSVVAEVSTRGVADDAARLAILRETVDFARTHTARTRRPHSSDAVPSPSASL